MWLPVGRGLIPSTAFSGAGLLPNVVFDRAKIGVERRLDVLVANSGTLEFLIDLGECFPLCDTTEAKMTDDELALSARGLECNRLLRRLLRPLRSTFTSSRLTPRTGWSQVRGVTGLCTMFWHLRVTLGGTLVRRGVRALPRR